MRFDYSLNVLSVYGYFWQQVWKDKEFISALAEGVGTMQQQTEITFQEFQDHMSRLTVPVFHHQRWKHVTFSEKDLTLRSYNFSDGLQIGNSVLIGSSVPPTQYVLPWMSTLQTFFIADSLDLETPTILNAVNDYTINGDEIIFFNNPFDVFPHTDGIDDNNDPVTTIDVWAYCSDEDIGGVTDFFGTYVGINTQASELFDRLTNIVWDLYVQGATIQNINTLLLILTDCDSVTLDGVVSSIFTEAGREWVLTDTGLYGAPEGTGITVSVNDTIYKGQNIFDTFKVYDGYDTIADTIIPSFKAEAGYLGGDYISGLSFDNKDVELTFAYMSSDAAIEVLEDDQGNWLIRLEDGVEYVLTSYGDYAVSDLLSQGVVAVPIFEIGGFPEDVERLRRDMADVIWKTQTDVYASLTEAQAPPFTINPFEYIQQNALKNNMIFIDLDASALLDSQSVMAAMRYLVNTVPAGTTFLMSMGATAQEEVFNTQTSIEETVTGYIVAELEEEYDHANTVDTLHANKKVG